MTIKAEQKIKEKSHQLSLHTVLVGTQADRLKSFAAGEVKLSMLLEKKSCHFSTDKYPWLLDQQDILLQTSTSLPEVKSYRLEGSSEGMIAFIRVYAHAS